MSFISLKFSSLAGPHNAIVATQGIRRFDTSFTINNTRKEKIDILLSLYEKAEELYDRTKQVSLELYSTLSEISHRSLLQPAGRLV